MYDLSQLSDEVKIARGEYSTVRSVHEDSKKELQERCGELMSLIPKILNHGQANDEMFIDMADEFLREMRRGSWKVKKTLKRMRSLAKQRKELKEKAWK